MVDFYQATLTFVFDTLQNGSEAVELVNDHCSDTLRKLGEITDLFYINYFNY